ncbi:hypothetical protein LTR97_006038 [Elasticomyces elasticus]|uniref:Uncharacterized protein n=1 Tax=Elasticomyces elasticus TaxID=574655 RepID=A0AAN7WJ26_9PEZI|nr:hypothetical protein LTR97_006038 [Elasticomyces elasticus]
MGLQLTEKEQRLFLLATQCFEGGDFPKVDCVKLAEIGGWKNKASANVAWCNLKKKLLGAAPATSKGEGEGGDGDEGAAEPSPKKRGRKPKATAEEVKDEVDEEEAEAEAPTPKKRGRPAKAKAAVEADEEVAEAGENLVAAADPDADAEVPAPKKRGRPAKGTKGGKKVGTDVEGAADDVPAEAVNGEPIEEDAMEGVKVEAE